MTRIVSLGRAFLIIYVGVFGTYMIHSLGFDRIVQLVIYLPYNCVYCILGDKWVIVRSCFCVNLHFIILDRSFHSVSSKMGSCLGPLSIQYLISY